jgi:CRP-like cAMP-binding protein
VSGHVRGSIVSGLTGLERGLTVERVTSVHRPRSCGFQSVEDPSALDGRHAVHGRGTVQGREGAGPELIRIFEAEPDLLHAVPAAVAGRVRREVLTEVRTLPATRRVTSPTPAARAGEVGRLVIGGVLLRRTTYAGRTASELVGPGDVIATPPRLPPPQDVFTSWTVVEDARVAVLDDAFIRTVAPLPGVVAALFQRSAERAHGTAFLLSVAQLPRLEDRLLALLWHLANRWGHVEREGVAVALPFSHATLGELVGARRPSVTSALSQLVSGGRIARREGGTWLLPHERQAPAKPLAPR